MTHCILKLALGLLLQGLVHGDSVFQSPSELTVTEGQDVTLNCNFTRAYSITQLDLFWYQQVTKQPPLFLLAVNSYSRKKNQVGRFSATLREEVKTVSLTIATVSVQDAAVYYCASYQGNQKLIFGKGTLLSIIPNIADSAPSVYILQPPKGKESMVSPVCLLTDFSPAHNTSVKVNGTPLNNSATLVNVNKEWSYGIVAWDSGYELECEAQYNSELYRLKTTTDSDGVQDTCSSVVVSEHFETDEKLNFLSITVLGLRIIFAKTIVINVLMTLRLCRS